MYKLFLTLRYLTRKKIVVFPILVVWLCVAMMVIVSSIMGGFVENVRKSNRELLGDIIISAKDPQGWSHYGDLQNTLQKRLPEIEAMTPQVHAYGIAKVSSANYTQPVMVNGIDPVGRMKVSKYREWLYWQHVSPEETVEDLAPHLPNTAGELTKIAQKKLEERSDEYDARLRELEVMNNKPPRTEPDFRWASFYPVAVCLAGAMLFWRRKRRHWVAAGVLFVLLAGVVTLLVCWPLIFPETVARAKDRKEDVEFRMERAIHTHDTIERFPADRKFNNRAELEAAIVPAVPTFEIPQALGSNVATGPAQTAPADPNAPFGMVIGSEVFYGRDVRGNIKRPQWALPAHISIVPVTRGGSFSAALANSANVVIIDDAHTGMWDMDNAAAWGPFERIQLMGGMRSDRKPGDEDWFEPRTNELLIKAREGVDINKLSEQIKKIVEDFQTATPDVSITELDVQTWDKKQEKYLRAVENEKVMMTVILGIMSLVVLVVIFLIFYMIVRDKTRDIGIIKAIGGSEEGVAGIFLIYGLFVGFVGGALGVLVGVEFVIHTNEIHDWIARTTGIVIWDRSVYVFDKIPNTINPLEVALYFLAALGAGMLGALIPAMVAGAQDPVKAVRYE